MGAVWQLMCTVLFRAFDSTLSWRIQLKARTESLAAKLPRNCRPRANETSKLSGGLALGRGGVEEGVADLHAAGRHRHHMHVLFLRVK